MAHQFTYNMETTTDKQIEDATNEVARTMILEQKLKRSREQIEKDIIKAHYNYLLAMELLRSLKI